MFPRKHPTRYTISVESNGQAQNSPQVCTSGSSVVTDVTPDPENLNPISQTVWVQIIVPKGSSFWLLALENRTIVYEIILDCIRKFVLD